MSKRIHWKTALLYGSAILFGIILGPFAANLAGGLHFVSNQPVEVQAADPIPAAVQAPDSTDAVYACTPSYVGEFINRVHVRCSVAAPGGIYYFATPTSDSKHAARVLSVLLTAKAMGKNLQIYYSPTASGASYNCLYSDCRPITYVEIMP